MESRKKSQISYPISDEEIIELYWMRDENAIKETDKKYSKYLFNIAYNIVSDKGECEECLNDTYMGAWNSMPTARPAVLQAFLSAIMRRSAIDCFKRRTRIKRVSSEFTQSFSELEDFIASDTDMAEEIENKDLSKSVSEYVRSLSERQMYIFMSRYYFSRPIKDIVKYLGCSTSTVKKEIAKIKEGLKTKLESEGYEL
ncbi:MAG: sigma-70 family RNA polymerase sigma factor [Clostridia bacterium]|nr:sigma-70 family RNA polymerase sigma factor [Clostridia bacterium]MBR3715502.1 sigma-70 family RNA polymerase sigma factor [Clostridia bacterium]